MVKQIIKNLNEFNLTDIVVVGNQTEDKPACCEYILDARSAGFYAFGKALKEQKSVALIVDGRYLPSLLTSMTEAWFQKANVIIIACYSHFSQVKCQYFERVTLSTQTVEEISSEIIEQSVCKKGPVLINLVGVKNKKKSFDYGVIPQVLKGEKLYLYQAGKEYDDANIRVIDERHKYGVISRYMGMLAVASEKIFLSCPAECLMIDLNVLNNRYSVNGARMIILDREKLVRQNKVDRWLESNGISAKFVDKINASDVELVKNSDKPIALVVEGGAE